MATPHNSAEKGDFAKTVLMPGDPLRAQYIAENFLTDAKQVTSVRNVYGYTGKYKGKDISVMAHGMGMPSVGIYTYELYSFYDVENIIRIGSAGSISENCHVRDIVIAMGASTDSRWQEQYGLAGNFAPIADYSLLRNAVDTAERLGKKIVVGNVVSSDVFYGDNKNANDNWRKMGCLCIEMECAALYMNAARLGKKALGILTISDEIYTGIELDSAERQTGFNNMIELALESVK